MNAEIIAALEALLVLSRGLSLAYSGLAYRVGGGGDPEGISNVIALDAFVSRVEDAVAAARLADERARGGFLGDDPQGSPI